METPKPKRKYLRKEKKVIKELEEPIEYKSFSKLYKDPKIYLYYEGHNIDTLKYIRELQNFGESFNISSQVVICALDRFEHSVKFHNCFFTDQVKEDWTWLCLSKESFCAVKIKERPSYSALECFNKMKQPEFEDDFIIVKDIFID